ncbi:MAG: phosphatase PAP2 family protein [Rhodobacteraceae bacterium]|nr:phosphatase PAP2 family protein [Paracoccaceae bacterium]
MVWDWAFRNPVKALLSYLVFVSLFFLIFPGVDLWFTGLFHSSETGFWAKTQPFLRRFRHLGPHIVQWVAIACLLALVLKLLFPGRTPLMPLRVPVFLLSTLVLGPGILVNAILKNNWGRPRPVMVDLFGGDMPYQPVWLPTNWCDTNCSFVSGEASAAMWLLALVFVAPKAWRWALACFLIPLGLLLSLNRVAFGGHFLSDTLISWGLTLLLIVLMYRLLFYVRPAGLGDRKLDEILTRTGRRLHVAFRKILNGYRIRWRRFCKMFTSA